MRLLQLVLLLGVCFLLCCRQEYLDPPDYIKYIRDPKNGFIQQQNTANLRIEAFYQPPAYVALMQTKPGRFTNVSMQHTLTNQSAFYQFILSIRSQSGLPIDDELAKISNNPDSLEVKKQIMFYRLENAFTVLVGMDSLPCVFYHPQLTGKIDNAYQFILDFESGKDTSFLNGHEDLHLIYRDSLWSNQRFEFIFNKESIAKAPKLKL